MQSSRNWDSDKWYVVIQGVTVGTPSPSLYFEAPPLPEITGTLNPIGKQVNFRHFASIFLGSFLYNRLKKSKRFLVEAFFNSAHLKKLKKLCRGLSDVPV